MLKNFSGGVDRASAMSLTLPQRVVLDALCRRIVPAAYAENARRVNLPDAVEAWLASGDAPLFEQISLLLTAFDHPIAGVLFSADGRRFSVLSHAEQDERLRSWQLSRIGIRRTVFQAFRRLVLSTYYAMPVAQSAIGFRGPLHSRAVSVTWEGPLSGVTNDREPVARGDRAAALSDARPARSGGVIQGHEIDCDTSISADACVIGTGAGGAVVAARLAEAGYDVVVLEEGGYWSAADFTEDEAEMVPRLYADRGARATEDLAVSILQGRCVGGGTTVNWMMMLRTPGWVLDEWARHHGTEGMSSRDLSPVFDLIENEVHARVVPDDAHSPSNRIILDGAKQLGWAARAATNNARDCIRAGSCGLGCRYGAKQSTLVTYIPRALARGARVYSDVRVDRLERIERGGRAPLKRVHGVVLCRATGTTRYSFSVDAPLIVLAAGAVGTPAILQRSGMAQGGVGKYLRLHPTSAVIGVYEREMYGTAGIPQSALSDEFLQGENGYGFWIECPALLPGLASVALPEFGDEHRRTMERFPNLGTLIVLTRDGANRGESNGSVSADRRGHTRLRYRLAPEDTRTLRNGLHAAARLHFAAGAREVRTTHTPSIVLRSEDDIAAITRASYAPNQIGIFSAHVNGTCRIGSNLRTSGCSPDAEHHDVPGLYIADGSMLPTAPGVNPQQTIMALATVIARRIIDRHPMRGAERGHCY